MTLDGWLRQDAAVPRLDRELLLMHRLAMDRTALIQRGAERLSTCELQALDADCARLAAGEPLAYLTGERGFWDFTLAVTPEVLIPRPETETLVEAALDRLTPGDRVLDLGTGSGAIAIALARSGGADVTAVDASAAALAVARDNAGRLGAAVEFLQSSWFQAVSGFFAMIVANPPYVAEGDPHLPALRYEPRSALVAGKDGLDDLRHIIAAAPAHLRTGGWLLVEHGYDQGAPVADAFTDADFGAVDLLRDLGGQPRVTLGRLENAHGSQ